MSISFPSLTIDTCCAASSQPTSALKASAINLIGTIVLSSAFTNGTTFVSSLSILCGTPFISAVGQPVTSFTDSPKYRSSILQAFLSRSGFVTFSPF